MADIIKLPLRERVTVDVRSALLHDPWTPTLPIPRDVQKAIDKRAREMSKEAYSLCREHLQRRVAGSAEIGSPRRFDSASAYAVIDEGDLGDALVRPVTDRLLHLELTANIAVREAVEYQRNVRAALYGECPDDGEEK